MTSRIPKRLRSVAVAAPAAALLIVGTAVPANAVVQIFGDSYVQGDNTNEYIPISCVGGVLDAAGVTGGSCATLTNLTVYPLGGTDTVEMSSVTAAAFPLMLSPYVDVEETGGVPQAADTVMGSAFADTINGDSSDTINGADGNDAISGGGSVSGGLGDDTIFEFQGTGTPTGGPGDDRFVQFLVIGGVEGGPGFDSYELDLDRSAPLLGADLLLQWGADTLHVVAGPTDAVLPIGGIEMVDFTMLRADKQTWDGAAFAAMQRVRGMAGIDVLSGGAADDALYGGNGEDTLTGGGGVDVLNGGEGNDSIAARDGVADRIDCGGGIDTVVADAVDSVVGCESVQLPPVVTPPPPVPVVPATGKVKGPSTVEKGKVATFKLKSPTAGATFQCKLDKGAWKACKPTHKVKTAKLKLGKHKLRVRAVLAGVVDPTPSVKKFSVTS